MLRETIKETLKKLLEACLEVYGESLVTLAIFGSVGRGKPSPDSDIDILLIAEDLPLGRLKRMSQFERVEQLLESWMEHLKKMDIKTSLSPVIKTREEVLLGSLLFLDMIDDALILYDKNGFFKSYLEDLSLKLKRLGAKKISDGDKWHWVLKPDYKYGEVFDI